MRIFVDPVCPASAAPSGFTVTRHDVTRYLELPLKLMAVDRTLWAQPPFRTNRRADGAVTGSFLEAEAGFPDIGKHRACYGEPLAQRSQGTPASTRSHSRFHRSRKTDRKTAADT